MVGICAMSAHGNYEKKGSCEMKKADEMHTYLHDKKNITKDKEQFVRNIGWLFSQTRLGVVSAELKGDVITMTFDSGYALHVNVESDSYFAMIKDVCNAIG